MADASGNKDDTIAAKRAAEALIPQFTHARLLNQDQAGRRISLLGSINSQPAILQIERAAFASSDSYLLSIAQTLSNISNLGANDIYHWYLACSASSLPQQKQEEKTPQQQPHPDLKLNLIFPCTEQHIKKYSAQGVRTVHETPALYRHVIRPYMQTKREQGRLNWVYNIIEGRTEQEDVIFREYSTSTSSASPSTSTTITTPTQAAAASDEGFLILPDLNWDRKTLTSLHLLGLVERRDLWSLRDLAKKHLPWLRHMREKLIAATTKLYPELEEDQLKLYVHYQPTYYHFHVHVVHVMLEAGATQAVGKAIGLDSIIATLERLDGGEEASMADLTLTYTLGEASELWIDVFEPLKRQSRASGEQSALIAG